MPLSPFAFLFLKGILVGFLIAAPVGPIGILCIRRTLSGRFALGLATGLGAGVADTVYGAIAGFSLGSIAALIQEYNFYLRLFGGILLGWIGYVTFKTPLRQRNTKEMGEETLLHGFTSAFFLTLSNPITLIVFAASFSAVHASPLEGSFFQALFLVLGVFVGASGWWLSLSTIVHLMHKKLSETQLFWINRISGLMLLGFSAYMLLSLF